MSSTSATHFRSDQVDNGGQDAIDMARPYRVRVTVVGTAPLLFHRWDNEAVSEKAAAAKGSKARRTDNLESYVYRTADGYLGVPGLCFVAALGEAARYESDPRSSRKSLRDLVRATVIPLDDVAPLLPKAKRWDFEDRRRVQVQRAAITRIRPGMLPGWEVAFRLLVTRPQYIALPLLTKLANDAGVVAGLLDFRPTHGRFTVKEVELLID